MAFVLADRVKETTIVVGTGAATLLGAASGYQSFSAGIGASNTTYYTIADQSGTNWEVGYGTLDATGLILTRTTVLSSSNSGSAVSFSAGTKDVWCDYTAKKAVIQDSSGNVTVPGTVTANSVLLTGNLGTVTSVTGTTPISSSGGTTPAISISQATTSTNGYLSSTDWNTFNGKANAFTYTSNYIPYGQGTTTPAQSSAFQFNGTTLTTANDASISGLTVGKGGGASASNTAVGTSALTNSTSGSYGVTGFGYYALAANTSGNSIVGIGANALTSNTTGSSSVAIGHEALKLNTTASNNTAVGYQAGYGVTTGAYNTALGFTALYGATTGANNVAIGSQSLNANTSGASNTSVGAAAMYVNTTGQLNVAIGQQALASNTTASNNTAVGYQAGYSNTTGTDIVAIGYGALYSNSTGSYSTAVGYNALRNNTTGQNTAMGLQALQASTTGNSNDAFGIQALLSNTTGSYNVAIGDTSLGSNTTGSNNTGIGFQTLNANTTASNNTAVGYQALYSNTTGNQSVALGYQAGYSMATNFNLTAIGFQSLQNATGNNNTAVGQYSGNALTSGANNTFIGQNSGSAITTGGKNSLIGNYNGNQGGLDIRTASNYIVLSDGDGNPRGVFDGSGNFLTGTTSTITASGIPSSNAFKTSTQGATCLTLQQTNATDAKGLLINYTTDFNSAGQYPILFYAGTTSRFIVLANGNVQNSNNSYGSTSDERVKDNIVDATPKLDDLMNVKIRNFTLKSDPDHKQIGVVAQELETIFPSMIEENEEGIKAVKYSVFVPMLIKAIQELKAEVDSLKAQLGK